MLNSLVCGAQMGLILAAFIGILLSWTDATECLKDKALGNYPVNVYYCEDDSKPLCCEQDSEFTCCQEETEKNMTEQIQLWGGIIGIGILIAMFWICYRKDTYICEGETLSKRFKSFCGSCCGKRREDDQKKLTSYPEDEEEMGGRRHIDRHDTALTSRDIEPDMCQPSTSTADLRGHDAGARDHNPGPGPGDYDYDTDSGRGSATSSPHVSPVPLHGRSDSNEPISAHSYELRSMSSRYKDDDEADVPHGKKSKKGKKHSKNRHPKGDISL